MEGLSSRELFLISVLTIFNVKAQVPPRSAAWTNNPGKNKHFFSRVPHSGGTSVIFSRFLFWIVWKDNFGTSRFHCHRSLCYLIAHRNSGHHVGRVARTISSKSCFGRYIELLTSRPQKIMLYPYRGMTFILTSWLCCRSNSLFIGLLSKAWAEKGGINLRYRYFMFVRRTFWYRLARVFRCEFIKKTFAKAHNQYAQLIWIVRAIDFGGCLPIGFVSTVNFGDFVLELSGQLILDAIRSGTNDAEII